MQAEVSCSLNDINVTLHVDQNLLARSGVGGIGSNGGTLGGDEETNDCGRSPVTFGSHVTIVAPTREIFRGIFGAFGVASDPVASLSGHGANDMRGNFARLETRRSSSWARCSSLIERRIEVDVPMLRQPFWLTTGNCHTAGTVIGKARH
ncbi:hypothetical protein BC826DRAFT_982519 [Russula brevipes]|nr:hypothetical protein BC826DRAFT_982519 [Russula brevipes]